MSDMLPQARAIVHLIIYVDFGHRELGAKVLKGDRRISREHAKLLGHKFGIAAEIFLR